jgi:protein required for attachment to host cells
MSCLSYQILIILGFVLICLNCTNWKSDVIKFSLLRLQGARDLAKPPTLTEIFQSNLKNSDSKEEESEKQGVKRKFDHTGHSSEDNEDDSQKANEQSLKDGKLKKAKNVGSHFSSLSYFKVLRLL